MKKIFVYLNVGFILLYLSTAAWSDTSSARETPVVKVVRNAAPSVVNISTEKIALLRQDPFWKNYGNAYDSLYQDFFRPVVSAVKLKSLGSGVIVQEDGLIVTNAHVINMATQIFVIFSNGESLPARPVLINQKDDLALIKVDEKQPLPALPLIQPGDVMIGETVVAVGNPYGLENSVSTGVISGKNRTFGVPEMNHIFTDLLQTDAPINIGNSGGALINLDGQLVGINLAVVQNAQNIGFAVPADKIREGISTYVQNKSAPPAPRPSQTASIPVRVTRA